MTPYWPLYYYYLCRGILNKKKCYTYISEIWNISTLCLPSPLNGHFEKQWSQMKCCMLHNIRIIMLFFVVCWFLSKNIVVVSNSFDPGQARCFVRVQTVCKGYQQTTLNKRQRGKELGIRWCTSVFLWAGIDSAAINVILFSLSQCVLEFCIWFLFCGIGEVTHIKGRLLLKTIILYNYVPFSKWELLWKERIYSQRKRIFHLRAVP